MRLSNQLKLIRAMFDANQRWALLAALEADQRLSDAKCPCCGSKGRFVARGLPLRPAALCLECGSLERHRLFALAYKAGLFSFGGKNVLHFAPEAINAALIARECPIRYSSADIEPGKGQLTLDIEKIDLPDESVDVVICNHVLEHVDDRTALLEMFRILSLGGVAILMVPLIEGWNETYEDATVTTDRERWKHFGLESHVRYFGADFRDRLKNAGFQIEEFTASGADCVRYSLLRGEKVFIATKPAGVAMETFD